MDIEHLTKSQIVLLTLLVSFVSSIATGIVTVTLMDQAPPAITETINRVVEHTVERIVPAETQAASAAAALPQPAAVKATDAVADAVAATSPSLVRIANDEGTLVAVGIAISPQVIASDGTALVAGGSFAAIASDGTRIPLAFIARTSSGIILFAAATSAPATGTQPFHPVRIAAHPVSLGERVIALSGLNAPKVAAGIITSLGAGEPAPAEGQTGALETDIPLDSLSSGTAFVDDAGALIGIYAIGTDAVIPVTAGSLETVLPGGNAN